MNPMIRKELRQRMRERRAWILPSLYLGILGGAVALAYYFTISEGAEVGQSEVQGSQIGVAVFFTVIFAQMALLLLLAPVFSAASVTIEKEQRTLAGLLTSLLTPFQIWKGKFSAALLFLVLLLFSALPILSLAFTLGGIGPGDVAIASGITLVVFASVSAIGLYCSSFFKRSVHATAVTYSVVIALTSLTFIAFTILSARWMATHRFDSGFQLPIAIRAIMYVNPFFPLISYFLRDSERFLSSDWIFSVSTFVVLGLLAGALAVRNLRRAGEQT
jgi:ABC-2 type transport system permease protein